MIKKIITNFLILLMVCLNFNYAYASVDEHSNLPELQVTQMIRNNFIITNLSVIKYIDFFNVNCIYNSTLFLYNKMPNATQTPSEFQIPSEIYTYADFGDAINSLSELVDLADYIVKGRILLDSKNIVTPSIGYTITGFKINEVYKGSLDKGNIIQLKELYFADVYKDGSSTSYYREDYTPSNVGEEYIFFLNYYPTEDLYLLVYSTLGRYSLDKEDKVTFEHGGGWLFTEENYSNVKNEVLLKYN